MYPATIYSDLKQIRKMNPLIHNITNFVVMQQTANALLAIGASPVMAHAEEEVVEMSSHAKALVLNMGTIDKQWNHSMLSAIQNAHQRKITIVFDPVGVGTTKFRTDTARRLIESGPPNVIRGNAGEILALAGETIHSKGVDSQYQTEAAYHAGKKLAEKYHCIVVISGQRDIILDTTRQINVDNGVAMMTQVTGMGCTATAIIAAFAAVNRDYFLAAAHAMAVMGIAAEIAAETAQGPGTLQVQFIDALYKLSLPQLEEKLKAS